MYIVADVLDSYIVISEYRLQLHYCIYFRIYILGKGMNLLILPAMEDIKEQLWYYKDDFVIELPTKVNMSLTNKSWERIIVIKMIEDICV